MPHLWPPATYIDEDGPPLTFQALAACTTTPATMKPPRELRRDVVAHAPPLELRPHIFCCMLITAKRMRPAAGRHVPIARRASLGGLGRTRPRACRNDWVRFHLHTRSTSVPAAAA